MVDTHETINCPACGEKMSKIFIKDLGINIDICDNGCGGIFFDNRELQRFDEYHEKLDEKILEIENKEFKPVDEDAVRVCPLCGMNMVKNSTKANGSTIIDECYSCGGKFLDHGELTKMRAEFATEKQRSEDAVKYLYSQVGPELLKSTSLVKPQRSSLNKLFLKLMGL